MTWLLCAYVPPPSKFLHPSLNIHVLFVAIQAICRYCTFISLTAILCQQSGMTPLHRAAHQGNSDVVKALIKAGSTVDEKEKASIIWRLNCVNSWMCYVFN